MLGLRLANMHILFLYVFVTPFSFAISNPPVPLLPAFPAITIAISIFSSLASATPVSLTGSSSNTTSVGPNSSGDNNDLPIVELPYGRFQASKYVKEIDVRLTLNFIWLFILTKAPDIRIQKHPLCRATDWLDEICQATAANSQYHAK